jgi:hypothetical protein
MFNVAFKTIAMHYCPSYNIRAVLFPKKAKQVLHVVHVSRFVALFNDTHAYEDSNVHTVPVRHVYFGYIR